MNNTPLQSAVVDPNSIRPRVRGESDFFSWQLYRWVKQFPYLVEIWEGTWNPWNGIDRTRPWLYIGLMDISGGECWFSGRDLRNLCSRGANLESFAYGKPHDVSNWKNITEQWWQEYARKGVCAIHGDYAHEWVQSGDERKCRWCGREEIREVTTELVEVVTWVPVEVA